MDKSVYLIEDDPDIAYIIQYVLEEEGMSVIVFSTIKSFKSDLHKHKPDLLILDVNLPDGNGLLLCDEIKTNSNYQDIPVMMLSAHCSTDLMIDNANAYISKPFNLDHLVSTVNLLIDNQNPH